MIHEAAPAHSYRHGYVSWGSFDVEFPAEHKHELLQMAFNVVFGDGHAKLLRVGDTCWMRYYSGKPRWY